MTVASSETITGHAAGVPFLAVPPTSAPRTSAPVVIAWHFLDPPRSETALAASLPLSGLDAWRIYLGLPMTGSRLPEGGWEELFRLGSEDPVLRVYGPISDQALQEFGQAYPELRRQLGLQPSSVGLMGGSLGATIAQLVLAESELDIDAAVLVSPVIQLRRLIESSEREYGFSYTWSDEANAVADRLDFVARVSELGRRSRPAILIVVGEQDDAGIREPANELAAALARDAEVSGRVELRTVPDMAHGLAEEPGTDPAPQTPHAALVDGHAVTWFQRHLIQRR